MSASTITTSKAPSGALDAAADSILRPSTSKTGQRYFYYICRSVQDGDCNLPALPLHKVEHAVTEHYSRISIPERHRETLKSLAVSAVDDSKETTAKLRASLREQLTELDRQEDRYLDLIGDSEWPQDKIKTRMQQVRESKQRITHRSLKRLLHQHGVRRERLHNPSCDQDSRHSAIVRGGCQIVAWTTADPTGEAARGQGG